MTDATAEDNLAEQLANAAEGLATLVDAVAGHRATLEAAGFSPTAAEAGAMEYHSVLMRRLAGL